MNRAADLPMLIVLLCCLTLVATGCTTTRTVSATSQASTTHEPKAGDRVHIFLKDGPDLQLTAVRWTDQQLVAEDASGVLHSIDRDDINRIEITSIDGAKTVLLVAGAAAIGLLVFFLASVDKLGPGL
jgi:hypothetical protein